MAASKVDPDAAQDAKAAMQKGSLRKNAKRRAKPNAKAPLGQGGRFAALQQQLASKPGVTNPGALAASIGRKKLGAQRFAQLSAKGRGG